MSVIAASPPRFDAPHPAALVTTGATQVRPRGIRVLLLVSSLERGGAERQVVQLANHLPAAGFDVHVCSLSPEVPLATELLDRSRLHIVEKHWRFDAGVVPQVVTLMRRLQAQVVHGFLFDAELAARLAARAGGAAVVVASERNTDYRRPLLHALALRLTRSRADVMIANSWAGKRFNMRDLGLPADGIRVVHNGIDVGQFRPRERMRVRRELGIAPDQPVIGMVASFKRQKNHGLFFRVARRLLARFPDARFLCVGEPLRDNLQGAGDYHAEMRSLVRELGLLGLVLFLGQRADMPDVYSACDATVLTSTREGTPNVLLESLGCGVPVVATNVADNAYVVPEGRAGYIVPLGDEPLLAERVAVLLADAQLRAEMGRYGRQWVEREFSIAALVRKTARVYVECLRRKGVAPPAVHAGGNGETRADES